MNNATTLKGLVLATAAAGLFATAGFAAAHEGEGAAAKVHCEGVNSCAGKGDCKGENGCKGKNNCKGQGFLEMSKGECDAAKAKMEKGN
jgi:hypothetical protein